MEFTGDQPIFLQIADNIMDSILTGKWSAEERIPSAREMAVAMEVNPNTVIRTYAYLQDREIIYNRRGIGYFVAADAAERIISLKREVFIKQDFPKLLKTMELLGITIKDLQTLSQEKSDEGKQQQ